MSDRNPLYIMVCARCLRASCWYGGEFMCDDALGAGVTVRLVDEMLDGKPDYVREKMRRVYGHVPDFSEALPAAIVA